MVNSIKLFVVLRYLNYFLGFLKGIIFAFVFTPSELGIWSYIMLILTLVGYTNLGADLYVNIEYSKRKNFKSKINQINGYTLLHFLIGSILLLTTYVLFDSEVYKLYQLLIIITIYLFQTLQKNHSSILRVDRKINVIGFLEVLVSVIITIPAILAYFKFYILTFTEIIDYTLILWAIGLIIKQLFFFKYSKLKLFNFNFNFSNYKKIYSIGFPLLISNISFYLIVQSNKILIREFLDFEMLGYFSFAVSITYAVMMLFGSVIWAIFPKLINDFSNIKTDMELKSRNIEFYQKIYSFLIFLVGIVIIIISKPLLLYFLPKYLKSIDSIIILIFAQYFISNSIFYKTALIANYEQKNILKGTLFSLIISILLSTTIISSFGDLRYIGYSICLSYFLISLYNIYYYSKMKGDIFDFNVIKKIILPKFFLYLILFVFLRSYYPSFQYLILVIVITTNFSLIKESINLFKNDN